MVSIQSPQNIDASNEHVFEVYDDLASIVEYTAIDNFVHARCQKEWDDNVIIAEEEAYHLFENIYRLPNKHIYIPIIETLIEYCISGPNAIIDTNWDDYNKYFQHIRFITELCKEYEIKDCRKNDYLFRPFGTKLTLDLQELILNINYFEEKKVYDFILTHTNRLLLYLKKKFYNAKGYFNWKPSHLKVTFEMGKDNHLLEESVTLLHGQKVILGDLIFSEQEKSLEPGT